MLTFLIIAVVGVIVAYLAYEEAPTDFFKAIREDWKDVTKENDEK